MAFVLEENRATGPALVASFDRYRKYLINNQSRFPPSAYKLASADWYFDGTDHRCPHDAWLERLTIDELGTGTRHEVRAVSLRIRLFGAYHDGHVELFYPRVFSYQLSLNSATDGHRDWLYDEFRLSEQGQLVHEIEWRGKAEPDRWIITASDVEYVWHPQSSGFSDSRLTSA